MPDPTPSEHSKQRGREGWLGSIVGWAPTVALLLLGAMISQDIEAHFVAGTVLLVSTRRDEAGRYQKQERIDPRLVVTGWDEDGRAFTFADGLLTAKESL